MMLLFKNKSITGTLLALSLTFLAGCSSAVKQVGTITETTGDKKASITTSDVNTNTTSDKTAGNTIVAAAPENNAKTSSSKDEAQKALLASMIKLAQQGKIINSEFPVKATVIDDVEKKLGKPDKTDWVPKAKGNYATFSKFNVVFGFNKGSQIFEARSFDNRVNKISLSMVKKAYGTPAYDVKSNGEEIIGYTAGKEYKILMVFPISTNGSKESFMDHYSVLYPRGTVNMMADDPGRQW